MSEKYNAFGRVHTVIGESSSDLLLKCAGKVKILWGNKFIDLIKDGKINVDSKFIYQEDSVGNKDGIYIVDEEVWIVVGGQKVNIKGETGNTYVSFLGNLETTAELKYNALVNIGFIYPDLSSINSDSLLNGVIYVESELKIYLVNNGLLTEFKVLFPNPFPDLFVIAKQSLNEGALVIKGTGINNSLAFTDFYIYSETNSNFIKSEDNLTIESPILNILSEYVTIGGTLKVKAIESDSEGFKLYKNNEGLSILEVDKVIERLSSDNQLLPEYWLLNNNIIQSASAFDSTRITINFTLNHTFLKGDIIAVYKGNMMTPLKVDEVVDFNSIKVLVDSINDAFISSLAGQYAFLIKAINGDLPIRIKDNNIDIVEYYNSDFKVKTKIGKLDTLNLKWSDNEVSVPISGHGMYSDNAVFSKAMYTDTPKLPENDNSSKFASTEWVNKKLSSNTDIDLRIMDPEVDVKAYFSRADILELFLNLEINTTKTYVCKFGLLTIAKGTRDSGFSAIVTAESPLKGYSHRSLYGIYDPLSNQWYGTSTYIIKDQANPGYYWSREFIDGEPTSPQYIGITNTETVSENMPYILYTNDGKTWELIDSYIAPDSDFIYFAASGTNALSRFTFNIIPIGYIGIVKADGTTLVNTGISNYAVKVDEGESMPESTKTLLINTLKDALPGVIPSIPGLPAIFYIHKSDISIMPENRIYLLENFKGKFNFSDIFKDAKIKVYNLPLVLCRWTDSSGYISSTLPLSTSFSIENIEFWKDGFNILILAGYVLCEIFRSIPDTSAEEVIDTIYSDTAGFAQSCASAHWENYSFFKMTGVCESDFAEPTEDNVKAGLRMKNSIDIVSDSTHIYGKFHVVYRDYKWPQAPDANFPYLSTQYNFRNVVAINRIYRLPYPNEILLSLVFNGLNGNYKIEGTVGNNLTVTAL